MVRLGYSVCWLLAVLGACASGGENTLPDYVPDAATSDGPIANSDGPPGDSPAVCNKAKVLYLNFNGQALTKGTTSDAKTNVVAWMAGKTAATAPAFGRNAEALQINSGITSGLSAMSVDVVTVRPASGDFMMIVFGGDNTNIGTQFTKAVQSLDCGNLVPSDVAWIAGSATVQEAINFSLGAVGFGVGLTATTGTSGCMCGWANSCQQVLTAACTFSGNIATDPMTPTGGAAQTCPGVSSQNETMKIQDGFCQ